MQAYKSTFSVHIYLALSWPRSLLIIVLGSVLFAGCTALHRPIETEEDIARRFLPAPRSVPHPDSLSSVHLYRSSEGLSVEMDTTFGAIWKHWSSGPQQRQGVNIAEADDYTSFATLRSREMRLAVLNRATPLSTYPVGQADSVLHERVEQPYSEEVAFDVYMYTYGAQARLANLNTTSRVFLKTDSGTLHEPVRIEHGRLGRRTGTRRTRNASQVVYRRNRIVFERHTEEEGDLLDSSRLEVHIRTTNPISAFSFEWELPTDSTLARE